MRPQQQNRRMRGRGNNNNNNRKGPNPLTRNYESNGPDVKIRGSAQQIADKYTTLARDAQSSGDRVMAENYLQHAEHYNRIIAAAQAQAQMNQQRDSRDDDDGDDERDDNQDMAASYQPRGENSRRNDNGQHQPPHDNGQHQSRRENGSRSENSSGPQPVIEGTPAEVALSEDSGSPDNGGGESHVNGNGQEDDAQPRRAKRPRRPRVRADDKMAASASESASEAAEAS